MSKKKEIRAMTNQQLQALKEFAEYLRAKNDRTQEELSREEAQDNE